MRLSIKTAHLYPPKRGKFRGAALLVTLLLLAAWAKPLGAQEGPQGQGPAISAKVLRYSQRLLQRYDSDGDGSLGPAEWERMGGRPEVLDADGDDRISLSEVTSHVANYTQHRNIRLRSPGPETLFVFSLLRSPGDAGPAIRPLPDATTPAAVRPKQEPRYFVQRKRLPESLPPWFFDRDSDGDGQLTLSEFTHQASRAEVSQFAEYDSNGDGLVTSGELIRGPLSTGTQGTGQPRPPTEARRDQLSPP